MKKKYILFSLFVILLFIGGCKKATESKAAIGAYVGGDEGLDLSFVEDEPPERVLDADSEQFFITLLLKNDGEFDIDVGETRITLSGIEKNQFQIGSLTETNKNFINGLEKKREETLPGGQDEISYTAKYKPDLNQDFTPTVTASACYAYGTRTLTKLCLRKDIARRSREAECTVDEHKTIENSGAPIQVTSLNEMKGGSNKIRVIFNIENVGEGTVYEKGSFSSGSCSEDMSKEDRLNVEIRPVSSINFKCARLGGGASGVIKLNTEGKAVVTCEADTSRLQDTAFEDPLNINLDYVYKERISKALTVEDAV